MEIHLIATECRLPYGITQCYLPPDTSEHTPPCGIVFCFSRLLQYPVCFYQVLLVSREY